MKIDSIKNGIVLDHISAGKSLEVYKALGLDKLDCSVAIIKNVKSNKMCKKDILKIETLAGLKEVKKEKHILEPSKETIDALTHLDLPSGVDIDIKL